MTTKPNYLTEKRLNELLRPRTTAELLLLIQRNRAKK